GSPHLAGLTLLDLHGCAIGAAGARALAESPHLARLTFLDLGGNAIGADAAEAVRQRLGRAAPVPGPLTFLGERRAPDVIEVFLADIVAHPLDDTPRLIYADWLEDNGQGEQADFIRIQCELAREGEEHPRWHQLRRRAADRLGAHVQAWLEPI